MKKGMFALLLALSLMGVPDRQAAAVVVDQTGSVRSNGVRGCLVQLAHIFVFEQGSSEASLYATCSRYL